MGVADEQAYEFTQAAPPETFPDPGEVLALREPPFDTARATEPGAAALDYRAGQDDRGEAWPETEVGSIDPRTALREALEALAEAASNLPTRRPADRSVGLQQFAAELSRLEDLATASGDKPIAKALACAAANFPAAIPADDLTHADWLLLTIDLPILLLATFYDSADREITGALLDCIGNSAWPIARSESELRDLRTLFESPKPGASDGPGANADDVVTPALPAMACARVPEFAAATEPQRVDPEHIGVLTGELSECMPGLRADIDAARHSPDAAVRCAGMLRRISLAAEAIGLSAFSWVLGRVSARVAAVAEAGLDDTQHAWVGDFPQRVRAYLNAPADPSAAGALIDALKEGGAFIGFDEPLLARLETALPRVQFVASERPQRATHAEAADVSLDIPSDISPELLDGLLAELPVQTADFSTAMQRVVSGQGSAHDLDIAKRAAHTLKGAANTVGVKGIANLTHHAEDILVALTKAGAMPTRALSDALVQAADGLEAMSEAVLGVGPAPDDAQGVLQLLLDWANRIDEEGVPSTGQSSPAAAAKTTPSSGSGSPSREAGGATAGEASQEQSLRVNAELIDELLRLVGETMIANTQIKEQLRQTVEHTRAVTRQNLGLQQLAAELEHLVDFRGVTTPQAARRDDLDALEFDHYNELHTVSRRLIEAATDSWQLSQASEQRLSVLAELLDGQRRLAVENQSIVMRTRIVQVGTIVSRLHRSVRQTARLLAKGVDLAVSGESTSIDGNVLSALVDPLMHLLRNAVDHGIEASDVRLQRGKPPAGRIELSFAREGSSIVVRCTDDGSGLDLQAIRARAEQFGLLQPGQAISDDELARLVLRNGFSTREEATQVSGRGIGLDAVYSKVLSLKGQLQLHTAQGNGLRVEMRLPASLMTSHGLLVRSGQQVVALSSNGIQDVRFASRQQARELGSGRVYDDGSNVYDLHRLDALLGRGEEQHEARDWFPTLLVQTDTGARRAIEVQEVLQSQEIVVKSLTRYVPSPHGIVGVTILGDGSIAPVIDMPALLRVPAVPLRLGAAPNGSAAWRGASTVAARRTALVVDDSLSARRAAAQLMRDAGFDVRTAIDGMEAAALLEKQVPDVILVDMEMPRMNGLELTTHIRTRESMKHLPVLMITSRSTDKHRKLAEQAGVNIYLTKPFHDEQLLEHVERLIGAAHA